jgi:hypothetical protein
LEAFILSTDITVLSARLTDFVDIRVESISAVAHAIEIFSEELAVTGLA